mmetsp:Transcript_12515/g.20408  ORF Transcript_12515/g.20408 Transcript_12515/m.20408 type:complete len:265 (-) Transcript_12515:1208-2002(-)
MYTRGRFRISTMTLVSVCDTMVPLKRPSHTLVTSPNPRNDELNLPEITTCVFWPPRAGSTDDIVGDRTKMEERETARSPLAVTITTSTPPERAFGFVVIFTWLVETDTIVCARPPINTWRTGSAAEKRPLKTSSCPPPFLTPATFFEEAISLRRVTVSPVENDGSPNTSTDTGCVCRFCTRAPALIPPPVTATSNAHSSASGELIGIPALVQFSCACAKRAASGVTTEAAAASRARRAPQIEAAGQPSLDENALKIDLVEAQES